MQQIFTDNPLTVGEYCTFTKEQAHHIKDVLHMDHEKIRLVHDNVGYFAMCEYQNGEPVARVIEQDPRINELPIDITLAMALIRREKFELVLQKATELGVKRIVPFQSSRCVVQAKKEKSAKQLQRWNTIVLEAAQQCKRNIVPEVTEIQSFKQLGNLEAERKAACYENAFGQSNYLTQLPAAKSIVVAIGPEGGFSEAEMAEFAKMGYAPITLGSRILRAETAALYALSVLAEAGETQ